LIAITLEDKIKLIVSFKRFKCRDNEKSKHLRCQWRKVNEFEAKMDFLREIKWRKTLNFVKKLKLKKFLWCFELEVGGLTKLNPTKSLKTLKNLSRLFNCIFNFSPQHSTFHH
jgi:hypothetical protein